MAGGFKNKELNILFKKRTLEEIIEFVFFINESYEGNMRKRKYKI